MYTVCGICRPGARQGTTNPSDTDGLAPGMMAWPRKAPDRAIEPSPTRIVGVGPANSAILRFMSAETKTNTISSFAAPTEADLRAFDALTIVEQKALVLAEIDKGFEGTPEPMTKQTSSDILRAESARLPSNAPR